MKKMNNKGQLITGIVIAIIAAVVVVFATPAGEFLGIGEPQLCDDQPNNYECLCNEGYIKGEGMTFFTYSCYLESLPDSWNFPIETLGEAVVFAKDQIGSGARCDQALVANWAGKDSNMPVSGRVTIECMKRKLIRTGIPTWRVDFSTKDGFIWTRRCNPQIIENCPDDIEFVPEKPEPQQEGGFFCNEDEFNDYVAALQGLTEQEVTLRFTNSCANTKGVPVFPYTTDTSIGTSTLSPGERRRMVCRNFREDGGVSSLWGFIYNTDGSITIDGNRDRFGFTEVGLCFLI